MEDQPEHSDAPTLKSPPGRTYNRLMLCLSFGAVAVSLLMIDRSLNTPDSAAPLPSNVVRTPSLTARPAPVLTPAPASPTPVLTAAPASPTPKPSLPHSPPTRLEIPEIHVDSPFTELSPDDSGVLSAPPADNKNLVGWNQEGPAPGETGTAVVVGHVDTKTGPAVFVGLSTLQPGNTVNITRADGIVATFSVYWVEAFPKDGFPDQQVYDDTSDAQLRLITCGGTYNRSRKDYVDNVVVFARLQSSHHQ